MDNTMTKIKRELESLRIQAGKVPNRFYFILLCIYLASCAMLMIRWESSISHHAWNLHVALFTAVMWASTIYLFYLIGEWKNIWNNTVTVIVLGAILFILTGTLSRYLTSASYMYIMGAFFCLTACGKNYRKILKCILIVISVILVVAFLAMLCGFAVDVKKPDRAIGGHSLGIIYPNNFGFLVFDVLILLWYLYLQKKKVVSLLLFWGAAVFMNEYITCRTVAGLSFLFPVIGIMAEWIQGRITSPNCQLRKERNLVRWLLVGFPFFLFAAMMILCWQMDWVHNKFYHTSIHTFAMRFVEGGYAIRLNGVSLFGHPLQQRQEGIIDYTREIDMKIDSAFTGYLILRGVLWMMVILIWIAIAHHKCLKNGDYRLLTISFFMLLLSVMERPGLDVWYNGVLLYPLAFADESGIKKDQVQSR